MRRRVRSRPKIVVTEINVMSQFLFLFVYSIKLVYLNLGLRLLRPCPQLETENPFCVLHLVCTLNCSSGDLTVDKYSQSAIASHLCRHIHDVIISGDVPSVFVRSEH